MDNSQDKFEEYLWRCWEEYNPAMYKAPYVTVVQSSGFGKRRMLFELARKAQDGGSKMKVLYTCTHQHNSTGFPVAKKLRYWLFAERSTVALIASRLEGTYDYAKENWDDVQTQWLDLFT